MFFRMVIRNRFLTLLIICLSEAIICLGQNPLIGAYYFDGWAGTNKVKNEAWAINAPTHLTKKLACQYQNRKPLWGWRDDDINIMEKQIKLASNNGIDFFSFCWYWKNDNSRIDTTNIMRYPLHTSIELFKKAKNKNRMKFSLLIANHMGARIKTEKDWLDAVDFWARHYFNDPQYLKIDGKPVITVFVSAEINKHIPIIREYVKKHTPYKDLFIISNRYDKSDSNFDMLSWYNIREIEPGHTEERTYNRLVNHVKETWYKTDTCFCVAPCVMVNWDKRPWQATNEGLYYIGRTPRLFKAQLDAALLFAIKRNLRHRIVMIYAWNELGEGGYLIPTQEDKNAVYLKQVKKTKERIKRIADSIK